MAVTLHRTLIKRRRGLAEDARTAAGGLGLKNTRARLRRFDVDARFVCAKGGRSGA